MLGRHNCFWYLAIRTQKIWFNLIIWDSGTLFISFFYIYTYMFIHYSMLHHSFLDCVCGSIKLKHAVYKTLSYQHVHPLSSTACLGVIHHVDMAIPRLLWTSLTSSWLCPCSQVKKNKIHTSIVLHLTYTYHGTVAVLGLPSSGMLIIPIILWEMRLLI